VVLNDLDPSVPLPYDLAGWSLERPTSDQFDSYRNVLSPFFAAQRFLGSSATIMLPLMLPYEARKTSPDGTGAHSSWDLSRRQWRYTVVRRVNPSINARSLTQALRLSDADIWTPLWGHSSQLPPAAAATMGMSWFWSPAGNPNHVFQFISGGGTDEMPECPDLAEISEVVELRRALNDDQYPEIARTLALFIETDGLPEYSTQKYLAYFGVIESLLTHAPKPNDLVDSLTRQLTRNILLLDNRLPDHRKLQLDTFKNGSTSIAPDKVIKSLYNYRSAAAHGGDTTDAIKWFKQNHPPCWTGLAMLEIHAFARSMAKRLLIAAMREPQLVQDLKAA
jgi:hypothetical protein